MFMFVEEGSLHDSSSFLKSFFNDWKYFMTEEVEAMQSNGKSSEFKSKTVSSTSYTSHMGTA